MGVCSNTLRLFPPLAAIVAVTRILFSYNALQSCYLILTYQSSIGTEQHVLTQLSVLVFQMAYHRSRQNPQNWYLGSSSHGILTGELEYKRPFPIIAAQSL